MSVPHALRRSTNITGLKRVVNAREVLESVYAETQGVLAKFPATSAYRNTMEKFTAARINALKETTDVDSLESKLQAGQIEEVVSQAEKELSLAKQMYEWKAWESLSEEPHPSQWKWP